MEDREGKVECIYGRVLSIQKKDDSFCKLIVKTTQGEKILLTVEGALEDPDMEGSADFVGRNIMAKGMIEKPSARRNPGGFDYKLYLKTRGIHVIFQTQAAHIQVIHGKMEPYGQINYFANNLAKMKSNYMSQLEAVMTAESYGILVGVLFGDKTLLDEDIYEAFQRNGVAHILSVSGIHVAVVYVYINKLLGSRRTLFSCSVAFAILFIYAALSEFAPSVVRAVIMIAVHIVSKLAYRNYDLLSCTSACALGMLLVNPYYLFNAGFQLSYLAVFCLAVMLPWLNRRIEFLKEGPCPDKLISLLSFFAPLMVIQMGMVPFTAYCFNYFSVVSFFLNIPIIAISGIIIPLGICLIPLSWFTGFDLGGIPIGDIIFGTGATGSELLVNCMVWINSLFYYPGVSFVHLVSPSPWLLCLYYTFLFFGFSEWFRVLYQRKKRKLIGIITFLFIISSVALPIFLLEDYSKANIVFLDVGQGDCLFLKTPKGKSILIDGGGNQDYDVGKKILLPYLLKNKVKSIDLALVTHLHDDHFLGIASLSKEMKIKQLGMYAANEYREKEIIAKTGMKKEGLLYLVKGQRIQLEEGVWIDVLYPKRHSASEYKELIKAEADENESSLFVKVHYLGLELLMTGDMGFEGEKILLETYAPQGLVDTHGGLSPNPLKADILKVGHHGSKYSTSETFLEAVSPKIAIIQVGKNNFGHPSQAVIENCEKSGIMIYRNDLNGAVLLQKGTQWRIKTMLQ